MKDKRVVVVVGGTRGIGLAISRRFAEAGYQVVAGARQSRPEVDRIAGIDFFAADMANAAGPDALVKHTVKAHGRLDVLVNNVGGGISRPDPACVSDDEWLNMLNVSFFYAVRSCRAGVQAMREQGSGGAIINISSVSGRMADPNVIDYAAAKAALESFSKSLSAAVAKDRIRVNTVAPGPVMTPLWTDPGGLADQFAQKLGTTAAQALADFAKHVPMGRFAKPEEVAALTLYLASDDAAIITGSNYRIDGGFLAFP